jgi:hypothetical protein
MEARVLSLRGSHRRRPRLCLGLQQQRPVGHRHHQCLHAGGGQRTRWHRRARISSPLCAGIDFSVAAPGMVTYRAGGRTTTVNWVTEPPATAAPRSLSPGSPLLLQRLRAATRSWLSENHPALAGHILTDTMAAHTKSGILPPRLLTIGLHGGATIAAIILAIDECDQARQWSLGPILDGTGVLDPFLIQPQKSVGA